MAKFKVGDIVRVIKSDYDMNAPIGAIAEIVDYDGDWIFPYELRFLDNKYQDEVEMDMLGSLYGEDELELADSKTKETSETSKTNNIILVSTDDWEGVYVGGTLEFQGHRIHNDVWLSLINKYKEFDEVESYWVDEDYMHDIGNLPHHFEELPKDILS